MVIKSLPRYGASPQTLTEWGYAWAYTRSADGPRNLERVRYAIAPGATCIA